MAWAYPKHICGHDGEKIQLYGPEKDREKKLGWIENQECKECKAMEYRRLSDAASFEALTAGLPQLMGSEKQIAWALTIRQSILAELDLVEMPPNLSEEKREHWEGFRLWVRGQAKSTYWIDSRNQSLFERKQAYLRTQ